MCGIGGFYFPDGVEFTDSLREQAYSLWSGISDRGTHASGVAYTWLNADSTIVKKGAIDSLRASRERWLDEAGFMVRSLLLHTRFTTQGSTSNNNNNHPVVSGRITLTHNGVITNDSHLFHMMNRTPQYQVDTEALSVGLGVKGVKWVSENAVGSMSLAWVDSTDTQVVNLYTNGRNPLSIGRTVEGVIVWASCSYHLEELDLEFETMFNATPFKHYTLSPKGIIESRFVDTRRNTPTIHRKGSHRASWGDVAPKKKKAQKGGSKVILGGMIFDEELDSWRQAKWWEY